MGMLQMDMRSVTIEGSERCAQRIVSTDRIVKWDWCRPDGTILEMHLETCSRQGNSKNGARLQAQDSTTVKTVLSEWKQASSAKPLSR